MSDLGSSVALPGDQARPSRRRVGAPKLWHALLRCTSIVIFFAAWAAFSFANARYLKVFNPVLMPSPLDVLKTGIELVESGELQRDILASLSRVLQGFAIAAFVGVALGMAVGRSRVLENLVDPMLELLRPIPPLAFLPMMVLWFGLGQASKIAFIAYAAFFPIFTTTLEGIKYVDPLLLRAAESLGANRRDLFRYVVLPAARPEM